MFRFLISIYVLITLLYLILYDKGDYYTLIIYWEIDKRTCSYEDRHLIKQSQLFKYK